MRTISLSLLAACALGGCHHDKPAPTIADTTPSGRGRVECPTGTDLDAIGRTYLAGDATAGSVGVSCVAVYTDRALWVLEGWHSSPTDDAVALVTALVDPATKAAVWTTGADDFSFPTGVVDRMTGAGMTAVDLDGDGKDELVDITGTNSHGYEVTSLSVMIIGPAGLIPAGEIPFSEDNTGADPTPADLQSCTTEWKLAAGPEGSKQLDLTVTAQTPGHDSSCLPPGHHVVRWTGKELLEVP